MPPLAVARMAQHNLDNILSKEVGSDALAASRSAALNSELPQMVELEQVERERLVWLSRAEHVSLYVLVQFEIDYQYVRTYN